MKKSYKKLLCFEIILILFLILNSLVLNILNKEITTILFIVIIIIFKYIFGLEKDKHRYTKDIIFDLIIVLIISFIIYYLLGIIIGFYKIKNYYNLYGISKFIIPTILLVVFKEYLRYQILNKSEGNKVLVITSNILFVLFDISTAIYYENILDFSDFFVFSTLIFIPAIIRNVVSSKISQKTGYKPNIMWLLALELYAYLIPIIPNPNEYLFSLVRFIFPLIVLGKVNSFFEKASDEEITRNYKKRTNGIIISIGSIIAMIMVVYFTSGYFHYYALTIASGSMKGEINIGDVVIIEKTNNNYKDLKEGQIIAYKYNGVTIVHRIVKIINADNKYYFYTKGDANEDIDRYAVEEENVIGIVNLKIPYIGLPTVWLKEVQEET